MAGDSFSHVDIAAFTIIKASANYLSWHDIPTLQFWLDRISERPGVQRGWTFDRDVSTGESAAPSP